MMSNHDFPTWRCIVQLRLTSFKVFRQSIFDILNISVEAPTAIDGHRSAQKKDCKFTVKTKRKKKSTIPRRLEKKIQEKKCLKKAIFDSQEKLLQRVRDQSFDGGKEILIAPPNMTKMSEIIIEYARPITHGQCTFCQTLALWC